MVFRRRGCFICGQLGHLAENCSFSERRCFNCLESGHESSACEAPRTADTKQCYGCGGKGHVKVDCPTLATAKGRGAQLCYTCGTMGHISRLCPSIPVSFVATAGPTRGVAGTVRCHRCNGLNQFVSFARDCKAPVAASSMIPSVRKPKTCYTCSKIGHIARDCPDAQTAPASVDAAITV